MNADRDYSTGALFLILGTMAYIGAALFEVTIETTPYRPMSAYEVNPVCVLMDIMPFVGVILWIAGAYLLIRSRKNSAE